MISQKFSICRTSFTLVQSSDNIAEANVTSQRDCHLTDICMCGNTCVPDESDVSLDFRPVIHFPLYSLNSFCTSENNKITINSIATTSHQRKKMKHL